MEIMVLLWMLLRKFFVYRIAQVKILKTEEMLGKKHQKFFTQLIL